MDPDTTSVDPSISEARAPIRTTVTTSHNIADLWEAVSDRRPDAPALKHRRIVRSWADFDRRADGVASTLISRGVSPQDKVAQYLRSCPEYLESLFACFKAGLVPVNTNFRYTANELRDLWMNADVVAVVFGDEFRPICERLRSVIPQIHTWLWVGDDCVDEALCPSWAVAWEHAAGSAGARVVAPWGRGDDDLLMMYTGGSTGLPKGVMWRQGDLVGALDITRRSRLPAVVGDGPAAPPCHLAGAPLMHGTGQFNAINNLLAGGCVVTMASPTFDPDEVLDAIDAHAVTTMSIVGDVFARPIADRLDADPGRWDLSTMQVMVSSGVMWSADVKTRLLAHMPAARLVDALGSSEAIGMASSTTTSGCYPATARFIAAPGTSVIDESGRAVLPGSDRSGRVALSGFIPLGYYGDPAKSAETFPTIGGVRWSIPGDWATVAADGSIVLLGRGSQCINTGGEKVYPEEVEEIIKLHPGVADAAVVGLPDERFGQKIVALVEIDEQHQQDGSPFDNTALITFVKQRLASYKAPRAVIVVDSLDRAANGKLDYRTLTDVAKALE